MHQHLRVSLGTHAVTDGSGAMALTPVEHDPIDVKAGALVELLELVRDAGHNIRLAGGRGIELGGEFVFALEDEAHNADVAALLKSHGYHGVRIVEVHAQEVPDEPGALADALAPLAAEGRQIDEIFVGVPHDGNVLVQATTIRRVEAEAGEA
jgi:hypothetical protein